MASGERIWLQRVKWRLRGSVQWPVFWLTTILGAVVLHLLPFSGPDGYGLIAGGLVFGFVNLGIVAALGPALGRIWRRREDNTMPQEIAADRASTLGMATLLTVALVAGIANHGTVAEASREGDEQLEAARAWFRENASVDYAPGIGSESVFKEGEGIYRTCIPGPDPRRNLCVQVDTSGDRPIVREDPDERPNSVVAGPDNPGRR